MLQQGAEKNIFNSSAEKGLPEKRGVMITCEQRAQTIH